MTRVGARTDAKTDRTSVSKVTRTMAAMVPGLHDSRSQRPHHSRIPGSLATDGATTVSTSALPHPAVATAAIASNASGGKPNG
jgi:hypothetical protein